MGMKQPAPAKDSSSSIAKKPSAAQDINSFLSKTPPMAPQEFSPKGKFDTKKIPAAQHTTTPADRRLSRSNTDSSGHTVQNTVSIPSVQNSRPNRISFPLRSQSQKVQSPKQECLRHCRSLLRHQAPRQQNLRLVVLSGNSLRSKISMKKKLIQRDVHSW
jgi:hypothetical protein